MFGEPSTAVDSQEDGGLASYDILTFGDLEMDLFRVFFGIFRVTNDIKRKRYD